MLETNDLRQHLRKQRQILHPVTLKHREQQFARLLLRLPAIKKAQHIAAYWPSDGELSPISAIKTLRAEGKNIYLPCIKPQKRMVFRPWFATTPLRPNRYGILEPASRNVFSTRRMDIVLTPLVAFDAKGNRIGMGAGFYDRAFAFRLHKHWLIKPKLIGLAHNFQEIDEIKRNPWDVGLSLIMTETRVLRRVPNL